MGSDRPTAAPPATQRELLASLGARFETGPEGGEVAIDFGSPDAEHRALRSGCGLFAPAGDLLRLTGEDRLRFLNGLVTCDVKGLAAGQGAYGFFTSAKGRVIADLVASAGDDDLTLELPPGKGGEIAAHLAKYIVADRVEVAPFEDAARWTLAGPRSEAALRGLGLDGELPAAPGGHRVAALLGGPRGLARAERVGVPAWTIWVRAGEAAAFGRELLAAAGGEVVPVGHAALERLRVEARVPRFGADFDEEYLPQETGLESVAVSFDKGCYLGQEVVARLHFRGRASRAVRALRFASPEPPAPGVELLHEERAAGKVTSVAFSPDLGAVGLGTLQRRALEPGTELRLAGGGSAEVVALVAAGLAEA